VDVDFNEIILITNQGYNTGIGRAAIETYRILKPVIKNLKLYSINYYKDYIIDNSTSLSTKYAKTMWGVPIINYFNARKVERIGILKNKNLHILGTDYSFSRQSSNVIMTLHEFYYEKGIFKSHSFKGFLKDMAYNYGEFKLKKYARNAKAIITPSEISSYQIKKAINVMPYVVPFSVDKTVYHPRNKKKVREYLHLPPDKNILINVSGSGINKNLKTLERIADLLPDNYLLLKINSPINSRNTVNLGYVSSKDYPLYLSASDIYIHTSISEGFGFPPVEAMNTGLPVVSNNLSTADEILGNDIPQVKSPYDYKEYILLINKFMSDYSKWSETSLNRSKHFSDENFKNKTIIVYKKVFD
jgi:glycosyltransferase involved in cell wall biosynthesis